MPIDMQYESSTFHLSEKEHHYGDNVHILSDPLLITMLAKLCSNDTHQPLINELVDKIYTLFLSNVINYEFPKTQTETQTRMIAHHQEGVFQGCIIDPKTRAVSVNLARAGTVPSQVCYSLLNYYLSPENVRQDHISIARQSDDTNQVTGSSVFGHKIGGNIADSIVLFPDPMGATGGSIVECLKLYEQYGKADKMIAMHCIITPEYIKEVKKHYPDLIIYAIRLDRGLSDPKILSTPPGKHWDQEKGLNQNQYIVPGGGGFGEILNNAFV